MGSEGEPDPCEGFDVDGEGRESEEVRVIRTSVPLLCSVCGQMSSEWRIQGGRMWHLRAEPGE